MGCLLRGKDEVVNHEKAVEITEVVMRVLAAAAVSSRGYIHAGKTMDDDGEETGIEEITFDGKFLTADLTAAIEEVEL